LIRRSGGVKVDGISRPFHYININVNL